MSKFLNLHSPEYHQRFSSVNALRLQANERDDFGVKN